MSVSVSVTKQTVTIDDGRDVVTVSPVTQSVSIASVGAQGATGATGATGPTGPAGPPGTADASAVLANNYHAAHAYTATSIETIARGFTVLSNVNYANSGRVYFTMVRPVKDLTVGTASIYCVNVGTAMTLARMGLYTFNETSGTAILVAQTANDTSIFGTAAVIQSRAFDTTGGYPATYTMTAGSTYAWAVVYVGTGIPFVAGLASIANLMFTSPRISASLASQSDLPGTATPTGIANVIWGRLS